MVSSRIGEMHSTLRNNSDKTCGRMKLKAVTVKGLRLKVLDSDMSPELEPGQTCELVAFVMIPKDAPFKFDILNGNLECTNEFMMATEVIE